MAVGSAFIAAVLELVYRLLDLYMWVLIVGAVLSWLIAFGIVDPYNRYVRGLSGFLTRITEPALRPIRRIVPPMGGLDLSPLILIFIIGFLKSFILRLTF